MDRPTIDPPLAAPVDVQRDLGLLGRVLDALRQLDPPADRG